MATQNDTKQRALITGASAGIGEQLAHEFARNGHDLVLVARTRTKLDALAADLSARHGVNAEAIPADLLDPEAPFAIVSELEGRGLPIGILVNNAGMLEAGQFHQMDTRTLLKMVQLNVGALTALSSLFVKRFVAAGGGRLLNVASIGSFQPVPGLAAYAATKAYVLSLTEALSEELRETGVTVSALCPGITDTGMVEHAKQETGGRFAVPRVMMSDPGEVARAGYRAVMSGQVIQVPGAANQFATTLVQYQPRWLVRALGGMVGRQLDQR